MLHKIEYTKSFRTNAYLMARDLKVRQESISIFFGKIGFREMPKRALGSWNRLSSYNGIILNDDISYIESMPEVKLNFEFPVNLKDLTYRVETSLHDPRQKEQVSAKEWNDIISNIDKEFSKMFVFYPESFLFLPESS